MLSFKFWVGLGHIRTKKHLKLPFLAQNNLSANGQHFFLQHTIRVCKGVSFEKTKLKTCFFLVNIELESAPKKMLIFYHFFQKGEEGEGERGGSGTKKNAFSGQY